MKPAGFSTIPDPRIIMTRYAAFSKTPRPEANIHQSGVLICFGDSKFLISYIYNYFFATCTLHRLYVKAQAVLVQFISTQTDEAQAGSLSLATTAAMIRSLLECKPERGLVVDPALVMMSVGQFISIHFIQGPTPTGHANFGP